MDEQTMKLIKDLETRPGASESVLHKLLEDLQVELPKDYLDFLRFSNGAEGSIGPNGYLRIWEAEEVSPANKDYKVAEYMPGVVLIGSNGANTAYGIDIRNQDPTKMEYIETDFIGMGWKSIFFRGASLYDLLAHLYNE